MREKIEGYVEHIVYRNEENGYTVLNLSAGKDEITCVGSFQSVHEGEYLEAEGQYGTHATYGQQFKAEQYRIKISERAGAGTVPGQRSGQRDRGGAGCQNRPAGLVTIP